MLVLTVFCFVPYVFSWHCIRGLISLATANEPMIYALLYIVTFLACVLCIGFMCNKWHKWMKWNNMPGYSSHEHCSRQHGRTQHHCDVADHMLWICGVLVVQRNHFFCRRGQTQRGLRRMVLPLRRFFSHFVFLLFLSTLSFRLFMPIFCFYSSSD